MASQLPQVRRPHIAALLTCHNRKALTLAALQALALSAKGHADVTVFLVDDASRDGTAAEVSSRFPATRLLKGDGNLYWNGGMRMAWKAALADVDPFDFYLWLNDDLAISSDTVANMLADYAQLSGEVDGRLIVVGKTVSGNGEFSYGCLSRAPGISRLRFRIPVSSRESVVTMNGNCVLLPARAAHDVGINSVFFRHAFGDIDYGLRATRAGYRIHQMEVPVGRQERGPAYSQMKGYGLKALIEFANSPKGMPWREWGVFCIRHGGLLGPVNFVAMYASQFRKRPGGLGDTSP